MPTLYTDVLHTLVGGHDLYQIIIGGGRIRHYLDLGMCTIYAYRRFRGRGGTRKRGGVKIRSHTDSDQLGPNEFAIIDVDPKNNNHPLLLKLENIVGFRVINYDAM
jgi:hypothetical protein